MSDIMKDVELLKELLAKATPGPWFWKQGYEMTYGRETLLHWGIHNADSDKDGRVITTHLVSLSSGRAHGEFGFLDSPDVQLVCAARNIVPNLLARLETLEGERDALKKFKEYVHARMDQAGVPADPPSPHRDEGCRIGGRLDCLVGERDELRTALMKVRGTISSNYADVGEAVKMNQVAEARHVIEVALAPKAVQS